MSFSGSDGQSRHATGFVGMAAIGTRRALFIDGANLHATARVLGIDVDYKRLLRKFLGEGTPIRAFYYAALTEATDYSAVRPLLDWLSYNGFTVVTKAPKNFDIAEGRRIKGNIGIELAIDAMGMAKHLDEMVLVSGDGSFSSLVEAMQRRGVRVFVVSTLNTRPAMIADELRRRADVFIDLKELENDIVRSVRYSALGPAPAGTGRSLEPANGSTVRRLYRRHLPGARTEAAAPPTDRSGRERSTEDDPSSRSGSPEDRRPPSKPK